MKSMVLALIIAVCSLELAMFLCGEIDETSPRGLTTPNRGQYALCSASNTCSEMSGLLQVQHVEANVAGGPGHIHKDANAGSHGKASLEAAEGFGCQLLNLEFCRGVPVQGVARRANAARHVRKQENASRRLRSSVVVLDFEGLTNNQPVLGYYGPEFMFGNSALAILDSDVPGGGGNIANEPSPSTVVYFLDGGNIVLNVPNGFDTGFSFFYSSSGLASVRVYTGVDRTGSLLATLPLASQFNVNCGGDPTGQFCNWSPIGVAFIGTARSIDFSGVANQAGFDDITFGSANPGGNSPPVAVCADRTLPAGPSCQAAASIDGGSSDPDGDAIEYAQSPLGPYVLGETTVELTVTDQNGASDSCLATVTVQDEERPVINCPSDIVVGNDPGVCAASVAYAAPVGTDNCCVAPTIVQTAGLHSGAQFPVGTTIQTFRATDSVGNSAECSFDVAVEDVESPVLTCCIEQGSLWPPNKSWASVGFLAAPSDNCGNILASSLSVSVFSDEDESGGAPPHQPDARRLVATGTLQLRRERRGNADGRVYLILARGVDIAGNDGFCTSAVVVSHDQSNASIDLVTQQANAAQHWASTNDGDPPVGYYALGSL